MANYTVDGQGTNTAATTILYFVNHATTLHRITLFELIAGADVTADAAFEAHVRRITAENGTPGGSAVTPQTNDPGDPAADSNAVEDPSGEPTFTANANMLVFPGHQRATILWAPAPGREIIVPATGDNGLGFVISSVTSAFNQVVSMRYAE